MPLFQVLPTSGTSNAPHNTANHSKHATINIIAAGRQHGRCYNYHSRAEASLSHCADQLALAASGPVSRLAREQRRV